MAFVSKARLQPSDDGYFKGAPDLAIEVVSPGNSKTEIHGKIKAYFQAGTRMVWVLYPKSRAMYVYHSASEEGILGEADTLDGNDVLPGFGTPLTEIFKVLQ